MAGNLLSRDKAGQYEEEFSYDPVNRLIRGKYRRIGSITYADADQPTSHWTAYDRLGNVCLKRIGNQNQAYTYHGRAGCGQAGTDTEYGQVDANLAGSPHQVVQANGFSYRYNDRGHQVAADASGTAADRTLRYTLADQAYELLKGDPAAPSQRTRFWYGLDGARYKREELNGKRTLYLGNVEIITTGGGTTTTKRYVAGVMVQEIVGSSATNKYLFHDHLGSVARIANAAGQLLSGMDFAPFGERRGWRDPRNPASIPAATTKGFTGWATCASSASGTRTRRTPTTAAPAAARPGPIPSTARSTPIWRAARTRRCRRTGSAIATTIVSAAVARA